MTEEINPSELGAFTNNLPNKEGIKKLVSSLEGKQEKLTAGTNITITDENVISAAGGKVYTAGDNISISEQDVISATDTKYTAGSGIYISDENVISASGGSNEWTLRTPDNDWSDLFDKDTTDYKITAKKDILLYDGSTSAKNFLGIIPKGMSERSFNFGRSVNTSKGTDYAVWSIISINYNKIDGTSFNEDEPTFYYDTTENKIKSGSNYTGTYNKSYFIIYTK